MPARPPEKPLGSPKDRRRSGVHAAARRQSFLVLAGEPAFATWLVSQCKLHGDVIVARSKTGAVRMEPPAGYWSAALLDATVPDGSGFEVLDVLRVVDRTVPVLLFAEKDEPHLANLAFEKCASLLIKPASPAHVQLFLESPVVRTHGDGWHERRERLARLPIHEAAILEITEAWADRHELTPTETAILHLGLQGLDRAGIAERRGVSEMTIKSQVYRLLSKTGGYPTLSSLVYDAMHELFFFDKRLRSSRMVPEPVARGPRTRRRG